MPRKAKPPSAPYNTGTARPVDTQSAAAPTGMPYGAHQAQVQAQQAIPLPAPAGIGGPGGAPGGGPNPTPPPPTPNQAILDAAGGHPFTPVDLSAPPDAPEPLTAGLPIGPGAGAMSRPSMPSAADTLDLMATYTGDPVFAQLAATSRMRASVGTTPPAAAPASPQAGGALGIGTPQSAPPMVGPPSLAQEGPGAGMPPGPDDLAGAAPAPGEPPLFPGSDVAADPEASPQPPQAELGGF